ncbi:GTP-binding protein 1 [Heterostelium album PN500]|uniref:GTP-binding protein 1 n=1 Tax=Heterostelium pallidum (strain ATCC 26659 / Pp 5 / PN500) TaxID=670386 RepID=D3AVT5_HETP5|nr:GTP-binding protein 1 [Heterostelium album PN500]EFA86408.1 GTP-binding protein 1 [Heterostelium album PN500]|eukprot:XP_020438513.1 GTP-binding protein 1 [Heterostelium album PN500]
MDFVEPSAMTVTTTDSSSSSTSSSVTTTNPVDFKSSVGNGLEHRLNVEDNITLKCSTSSSTNPTTTTTTTTTNNSETDSNTHEDQTNDNNNNNTTEEGDSAPPPPMNNLQPEVEYGNVEYKLKLVNPTEERLEHLVSQLKWRMGEMGEAIYDIGVEDDGTATGLSDEDITASMETLKKMASRLNSDLTVIRERTGSKGKVLEVLIRKYASDDFTEVRVTVVGNVDAGKSTLLGVLTRGQLDNGRGLARMNVFRHKHELESGRTSSISQEVVGFDSKGKIVNYTHNNIHNEIGERMSSKIITFIDLAGHEKYLKTTLFGMTGHQPDYTMLMIGANMGCVGMTKEHLGIALALRVPVYIVITKIDKCPENVLNDTMNDIKKILKSPGSRKLPVVIRNHDDVVVAARNFVSERIAPIFCVSNVTGENLDLLKTFLNLLPTKKEWDAVIDKPSQLDIDSIWHVSGVGTVVSGTVMKGLITAGENLLLGPDDHGTFQTVQVKTIHSKRLPVKQVRAGQTASIALKKIKRSAIRKGMILAHPAAKPIAVREFEAEVVILYHSTTISVNYEAVVHCGASQQCARIIWIDKGIIRTGDKAKVRFRYIARPEFLTDGTRFIFREGRAKGIGKITSLIPYVPEKDSHQPHPKSVSRGSHAKETANKDATATHQSGSSTTTTTSTTSNGSSASKKNHRRHKQ